MRRLSLTVIAAAGVALAALATPMQASASRWEVRQEVREGKKEVRREKREAARELRKCQTRECARREVREGYREVARERREAQMIEQMIDNRMDGLILVASQIPGPTMERYARQIPTVVVGHHEPLAESFDTVNSDDRTGAQMAVRALHAKGHRDIAMLAMEWDARHQADVSPQREQGYLAVMAELGLPPRILRVPQSDQPRDDRLRAYLTAPDRPRAIYCWSDLDAVPLRNMAWQLGLRVPEDLALVGYDNNPVAALPMIDLASVDQDGRCMGRVAAEALLTRIGGRRVAEHILIEPKLIPRGSL